MNTRLSFAQNLKDKSRTMPALARKNMTTGEIKQKSISFERLRNGINKFQQAWPVLWCSLVPAAVTINKPITRILLSSYKQIMQKNCET